MRYPKSEGGGRIGIPGIQGIGTWLWPIILFVVTLFTRIPFTSRFLYDQDAVQFALALEKYDVYLHQPHPPGYFAYVMLGKLINLFFQNANSSFLLLSLIGSGLTVVAVYYLGFIIFDRETGLWAAAFALTSPLLWYYGELALTYAVAAFFNTWIAILCWRLLQKESRSLYLSAVILGITGGIRQDVLIFLFPLWLFCVLRFEWKQVLAFGASLGITIAAWVIPMLVMTGGLERYSAAVRELWHFHNRTFAIWNAGIGSRTHFLLALLGNVSYGVGLGMLFLFFALYVLIRTGEWRRVAKPKILFFVLWLLPAFLFNIFVFMNPDQAGYGVFFLPALFVLVVPSIKYGLAAISKVLSRPKLPGIGMYRTMALVVIVVNGVFFLLSDSVVSAKGIRKHDDHLSVILRGIERNFRPEESIIIDDKSYQLYNYRHVQYYLRRYRVYLTALAGNTENPWHIFFGQNGQTFISKGFDLSPDVRYVVYLANPLDHRYAETLKAKGLHRLAVGETTALFYEDRR